MISLMVAQVCERELGSMTTETGTTTSSNNSDSNPPSPTASSGLWTPIDTIKLEIAVSLSFLVGIIQVFKSALLDNFFSDF